MIRLQARKGLTVLWVDTDNRSFDHLWPAYRAFPEKSVISVDDDKHFPPMLVGTLRQYSLEFPGAIIGSRGWQMRLSEGGIEFGPGWRRANSDTVSDDLFMPPGNGSLYPPGSLPDLTGDIVLMEEICPIADDVWYWAMAKLSGTESVCAGMPAHRPVMRQSGTPALSHHDPGPRDFRKTVDHFGFREMLTRTLTSDRPADSSPG